MRTTRKRVSLPFLFRAADCRGAGGKLIARSYGSEVEGVFTRASQAAAWDSNGLRHTVAHSVPPLGVWRDDPVLDMAAAVTNVCLQSENFGTTWSTLNSPTRTAAAHTATGISLDLLGDDNAAGVEGYEQTITFTGNGDKCLSLHIKKGTSTKIQLQLIGDGSDGRAGVDVTFSGDVPVLTNIGGAFTAATLFTPRLISDGVYRISLTAAGVVASQTNVLTILLTDGATASATGNVYLGGVQAENANTPGAYVKTTTLAASRVTDLLYFPFTLTPREMTIYARGYERMDPVTTQANTTVLWSVTNAAGDDAKMYVRRPGLATGYRFVHEPATVTETASVATGATINDLSEFRAVLSAAGEPRLGVTLNGGAESLSAVGTAQALATAWSGERLYLNSFGSNNVGRYAFTHLAVALGTKTLAEMRELAEVY